MYIYSSTSIDIKIKFEIPFHPNPRRAYNISSKPKSTNLSSQKVRKNHFQSIKKHNTKKYIYMATIFIQKKREKKNTKEHDPSTIEATFRQQEEKENTLYHGRSARRIACNQSRFKRNPVEDGNPADSLGGRFSFPNSIGARMLDTRLGESFGARSIPSDFARRQEIDYSSDGRLFLGFDGFLAFQRI